MPRVTIPIVDVPLEGGIWVQGGSLLPADGAALLTDAVSDILLYVKNTGVAGIVIVDEGDHPPALRAELGELRLNMGLGTGTPTELYIRLEGARHVKNDGAVHVDFSTNMTGFITAYRVKTPGAGQS